MTLVPAIAYLLKDGAAEANFLWIGALVTVLSLSTFVAWMAYAFFAKASKMEANANIPFDLDDDGGAA